MTHDRIILYNSSPPPSDCETVTIGVYVVGLGFNLFSLHVVQKTQLIVSDASSTHVISTNLMFPRSSSRSYLRATRLPTGTVGTRRRQGDMRVTNLIRELRHPVPPPPQEIPPPQKHVRDWYARLKCFGYCYRTGTDPFSPSQLCVGGHQVRRKNPL